MSSWLLLVLALEGLSVRTTTPLALCPTVAAVESAVSERLRLVEHGDDPWELVLENAHRTEPLPADLLRVQLVDPSGGVRLEQLLDVSGATCAVRAQSVALVVAESFEALRLEPAPLPTPKASEALATPTVAAEPRPAPPATSDAGERPKRDVRALYVGVGASLSEAWSPGFALRAAYRWAAPFELSATLLGPTQKRERLPRGGSAQGWALPLRLAAALSLSWPHTRLFLGPELLASYERGRTRDIPESDVNHRVVWGVGAQAGARFVGTGSFAAYVLVAADYPLATPGARFEVDGDRVLEPEAPRWALALGVDYDVF